MSTPTNHAASSTGADHPERLRAAGLRVTAPRLAVLDVLDHAGHADAETVAQRVRSEHHSVSTQAVYDVLNTLTTQGLVRRIAPIGMRAHYETRVGDNHHHVVCRECGAIDDIDCALGAAPCLTPSSTHGFEIDEADVTYWGLCPECAPRASA